MKTEQSTVYIADDGRRFGTEAECKNYEGAVLARIEKLVYYQVRYAPDLTEGRGLTKTAVLAVESWCPWHAAAQWLIDTSGDALEYVQGASPTPGWEITKVERYIWDEANNAPPAHRHRHQTVFISNGEPLEGFPAPTRLGGKRGSR